jgi:hypothetical protein
LIAALLALTSIAFAQDERAADEATAETASPIGIVAAVGASLDRGAFVYRAGARYRVFDDLELGLEVEHNPWYSLDALTVRWGSLNVLASGAYTWASLGRLEVRSTLHLGVTVLLFDLVGAQSGSVGPLLGATLLGAKIRLSDHFALLVEPAEVVLPIAKLSGVPVFYAQYRFTMGLQWNP